MAKKGEMKPLDYLKMMYDETDENGLLFLKGNYSTVEKQYPLRYRCKMKWKKDESGRMIWEKLAGDYQTVCRDLSEVAEYYRRHPEDFAEGKKPDSKEVGPHACITWRSLLRPIEPEGFDLAAMDEIRKKKEAVMFVRSMRTDIMLNRGISDTDREFFEENKDVEVTEVEEELYEKYLLAIDEECVHRVGTKMWAFAYVNSARKFVSLMIVNAPQEMIDNAACEFAKTMAVNRCGSSVTQVDEMAYIRYKKEKQNSSVDVISDIQFAKAANKRKTMIPLFIYLILQENSSGRKPLKQTELANLLMMSPYEVSMERKAISRHVQALAELDIGIYCDQYKGCWYEKR